MSSREAIEAACWVCGGLTQTFWANDAFESVACRRCGHIVASHRPIPDAEATDYHLGYEQHDFVATLGATRRRQAARLLDELASFDDPPRSIFDFGCGRGFFLEVAQTRGGLELAGGDVSELALQLLATRGLPGLKLDAELPFEKLALTQLPFLPEAITFLDVIEHFSGDLAQRLGRWLGDLPRDVRFIVFKVPVRDGLLFSVANLARRAHVGGPGRQLFQSGTFPPHYQYFSRRSLGALVERLELSPLAVLDDIDFEPAELGRRLSATSASGRALRAIAPVLGQGLGALVRLSKRADSRIVVARRRPPADTERRTRRP